MSDNDNFFNSFSSAAKINTDAVPASAGLTSPQQPLAPLSAATRPKNPFAAARSARASRVSASNANSVDAAASLFANPVRSNIPPKSNINPTSATTPANFFDSFGLSNTQSPAPANDPTSPAKERLVSPTAKPNILNAMGLGNFDALTMKPPPLSATAKAQSASNPVVRAATPAAAVSPAVVPQQHPKQDPAASTSGTTQIKPAASSHVAPLKPFASSSVVPSVVPTATSSVQSGANILSPQMSSSVHSSAQAKSPALSSAQAQLQQQVDSAIPPRAAPAPITTAHQTVPQQMAPYQRDITSPALIPAEEPHLHSDTHFQPHLLDSAQVAFDQHQQPQHANTSNPFAFAGAPGAFDSINTAFSGGDLEHDAEFSFVQSQSAAISSFEMIADAPVEISPPSNVAAVQAVPDTSVYAGGPTSAAFGAGDFEDVDTAHISGQEHGLFQQPPSNDFGRTETARAEPSTDLNHGAHANDAHGQAESELDDLVFGSAEMLGQAEIGNSKALEHSPLHAESATMHDFAGDVNGQLDWQQPQSFGEYSDNNQQHQMYDQYDQQHSLNQYSTDNQQLFDQFGINEQQQPQAPDDIPFSQFGFNDQQQLQTDQFYNDQLQSGESDAYNEQATNQFSYNEQPANQHTYGEQPVEQHSYYDDQQAEPYGYNNQQYVDQNSYSEQPLDYANQQNDPYAQQQFFPESQQYNYNEAAVNEQQAAMDGAAQEQSFVGYEQDVGFPVLPALDQEQQAHPAAYPQTEPGNSQPFGSFQSENVTPGPFDASLEQDTTVGQDANDVKNPFGGAGDNPFNLPLLALQQELPQHVTSETPYEPEIAKNHDIKAESDAVAGTANMESASFGLTALPDSNANPFGESTQPEYLPLEGDNLQQQTGAFPESQQAAEYVPTSGEYAQYQDQSQEEFALQQDYYNQPQQAGSVDQPAEYVQENYYEFYQQQNGYPAYDQDPSQSQVEQSEYNGALVQQVYDQNAYAGHADGGDSFQQQTQPEYNYDAQRADWQQYNQSEAYTDNVEQSLPPTAVSDEKALPPPPAATSQFPPPPPAAASQLPPPPPAAASQLPPPPPVAASQLPPPPPAAASQFQPPPPVASKFQAPPPVQQSLPPATQFQVSPTSQQSLPPPIAAQSSPSVVPPPTAAQFKPPPPAAAHFQTPKSPQQSFPTPPQQDEFQIRPSQQSFVPHVEQHHMMPPTAVSHAAQSEPALAQEVPFASQQVGARKQNILPPPPAKSSVPAPAAFAIPPVASAQVPFSPPVQSIEAVPLNDTQSYEASGEQEQYDQQQYSQYNDEYGQQQYGEDYVYDENQYGQPQYDSYQQPLQDDGNAGYDSVQENQQVYTQEQEQAYYGNDQEQSGYSYDHVDLQSAVGNTANGEMDAWNAGQPDAGAFDESSYTPQLDNSRQDGYGRQDQEQAQPVQMEPASNGAGLCSGCSAELIPRALFCSMCGTRVSVVAKPATPMIPASVIPAPANQPFSAPPPQAANGFIHSPAASSGVTVGAGKVPPPRGVHRMTRSRSSQQGQEFQSLQATNQQQQPQGFDQQQPVTEQYRFVDPLGRHRGHAIAVFGFGGKLVVTGPKRLQRATIDPNTGRSYMTEKSCAGKVNITSIAKSAEQTASIVPPILGSGKKMKKKDVVKLVDDMITRVEAGAASSSPAGNDLVLLWKLMKLMIEHDGTLLGGKPEAVQKLKDLLMDGIVPPAQTSRLDEIHAFLLAGNKTAACKVAIDNKLWAHALVISAQIDKDTYRDVVSSFSRQEFSAGGETAASFQKIDRPGLCILYALFGGSGKAAVNDYFANAEGGAEKALSGWKEILALILANKTPGDTAAISLLGDELNSSGALIPAQICYLLSPNHSPVTGVDGPNSRIVLLGGNHMYNYTRFAHDFEALRLSEVFEYSQSLVGGIGVAGGLPHLQAFKLCYALWLSEIGHVAEATEYCEAIEQVVKNYSKGSPYFHKTFIASLKDLSERLSTASAGTLGGMGSGAGGKDATSKKTFSSLRDLVDRGITSIMSNAVGEDISGSGKDVSAPTATTQEAPSFFPPPDMIGTASGADMNSYNGNNLDSYGNGAYTGESYGNGDSYGYGGIDGSAGYSGYGQESYNGGTNYYANGGDGTEETVDPNAQPSYGDYGYQTAQMHEQNGELQYGEQPYGESPYGEQSYGDHNGQYSGVMESYGDGGDPQLTGNENTYGGNDGYGYETQGQYNDGYGGASNDASYADGTQGYPQNDGYQGYDEGAQQDNGYGYGANDVQGYANGYGNQSDPVEASVPPPPPAQGSVPPPPPAAARRNSLPNAVQPLKNEPAPPRASVPAPPKALDPPEPSASTDSIDKDSKSEPAQTEVKEEKRKSTSWFPSLPSLFGGGKSAAPEEKDGKKVHRVHEGSALQLVYDPVQKKWVHGKTGEAVSSTKDVPPPPMATSQSAPASRLSTPTPADPAPARPSSTLANNPITADGAGNAALGGARRRGARNKYVDVMNTGKSPAAATPAFKSFIPVAGAQLLDESASSAAEDAMSPTPEARPFGSMVTNSAPPTIPPVRRTSGAPQRPTYPTMPGAATVPHKSGTAPPQRPVMQPIVGASRGSAQPSGAPQQQQQRANIPMNNNPARMSNVNAMGPQPGGAPKGVHASARGSVNQRMPNRAAGHAPPPSDI
ncbi:hypothetical protein CcCBS67573_g03602 [Chytriomyces confervae]|uniref:Protein transport protein sec16 n=1 Tax=Chytriomyces confervae TaxID=246404 RepID=A0A507FID3_9FUNG|nr:hypothetical protein CcCBS67573_g03602 [Chytriomyces confervae]